MVWTGSEQDDSLGAMVRDGTRRGQERTMVRDGTRRGREKGANVCGTWRGMGRVRERLGEGQCGRGKREGERD